MRIIIILSFIFLFSCNEKKASENKTIPSTIKYSVKVEVDSKKETSTTCSNNKCLTIPVFGKIGYETASMCPRK